MFDTNFPDGDKYLGFKNVSNAWLLTRCLYNRRSQHRSATLIPRFNVYIIAHHFERLSWIINRYSLLKKRRKKKRRQKRRKQNLSAQNNEAVQRMKFDNLKNMTCFKSCITYSKHLAVTVKRLASLITKSSSLRSKPQTHYLTMMSITILTNSLIGYLTLYMKTMSKTK